MDKFRVEKDSLGEMKVPTNAYYGAQTARAIQNFPISGRPMPAEFIEATVMIKKAAAIVNADLKLLPKKLSRAIVKACDEILKGADWTKGQFPVDVYQTGSGTSTNMNVNEVIASRANEILGGRVPHGNARSFLRAQSNLAPPQRLIHPNDHVNMGQSSNDVVPTALHVMAADMIKNQLEPATKTLALSLRKKSRQLWKVIKTGRTHLQDATPIRLGQAFEGFASSLDDTSRNAVFIAEIYLAKLPLGGTAVGTGINTHPAFARKASSLLAKWTWTTMRMEETGNHFGAQSTLDAPVAAHAGLKSLAVSLHKIANDIRWMGSGPRAGLGEITLPAVQPGSSIMPGKVNPVICESVLMVCQRVIGNDAAMTAAALGANFELAMSWPLAASLLHESITLLAAACKNFAEKCVDGITATERGPDLVESGLMLATALVPALGYEKAAAIAKEAESTGRTIREIAREKSGLSERELKRALDLNRMVDGR